MLQIYHGDGKGKTTAAVGLSVRASGRNIPVIFAQFLKDGSSGEIKQLAQLGVKVMLPDTFFGFVRSMSVEQLQKIKEAYARFWQKIETEVQKQITSKKEAGIETQQKEMHEISCVLILDEVLHACNNGLLEASVLLDFIEKTRDCVEIVMTGRNPDAAFVLNADYCTNFVKEKHPFDNGVMARTGIEQ